MTGSTDIGEDTLAQARAWARAWKHSAKEWRDWADANAPCIQAGVKAAALKAGYPTIHDVNDNPCGNCGCRPCMCGMPGFVTYRGYTLEQALASVGPGWGPLVRTAFRLVRGRVPIVQVKEKYGTLRIYFSGYGVLDDGVHTPVDVHTLEMALETASSHICELCGRPGTLREGGWWVTRCDECEAKP